MTIAKFLVEQMTCFIGFVNGMMDYYTHERCDHEFKYCGIDFHDHTQNRQDMVWNTSGTYSTMLFTDRAIDIVKNHDQTKVNCLL